MSKGSTDYQIDVNNLTGAEGPVDSAFWPNVGASPDPWTLGNQPLYYSPGLGVYQTAFEANAAPMSFTMQKLPENYGVLGELKGAFGRKRRSNKKKFGKKKSSSKRKSGGKKKKSKRSKGKK